MTDFISINTAKPFDSKGTWTLKALGHLST